MSHNLTNLSSISQLFNLDRRVALVTGGATGLGWTMACALAHSGADVLITSRRSKPHMPPTFKGGSITHIGFADVTDLDAQRQMIAQIEDTYDRLDILINNAGHYSTKGLDDTDEAVWDEVLSSNLKSVFFLNQAAAPLLRRSAKGAATRGKIINIGSVTGRFASVNASYAISKAGLHHMTQMLAVTLAKDNINVNAIAPAAFRTAMTEEELDALGEAFVKAIPVGRIGTPDDIAAAVVFLASRAADFITGHVLPLDGGFADLK